MAQPILEYGGKHGLAYRQDFGQLFQMKQAKALQERQDQADAAAKVKMMSDDMKYATVNNEFDARELKSFSDIKSKEIGKLLMENPDWETNPSVYIKYKQLTNELTNNDIIRRAVRYDAQAKELQEFIKKNPDMVSDPGIVKQLEESEKYRMYGNVNGEIYEPEIYDESGNLVQEKKRQVKEYTFTGLDMFDLPAETAKWAKTVGHRKNVVDKFGRVTSIMETTKEDLFAATNDLLLGVDRFKYKKAWNDESNFTKEFYNNQAQGDENVAMRYWLADMGKRYTNTETTQDDGWALKAQLAAQKGKDQKQVVLPFLQNVVTKQPGESINGNNLEVFSSIPKGDNGKYTVSPGTKGFLVIRTPEGTEQLLNLTVPQTTSAFPSLTFNNRAIKSPDGGLLLSYTGVSNADPSVLRELVDQIGYDNIQKLSKAFKVETAEELGEIFRQQVNKGQAQLLFEGEINSNSTNLYDKGFISQNDATANNPYYNQIPGIKWSNPKSVGFPNNPSSTVSQPKIDLTK